VAAPYQPQSHRRTDRCDDNDARLNVRCQLDPSTYPSVLKVSDADFQAVNLKPPDFYGNWDYTHRAQPSRFGVVIVG